MLTDYVMCMMFGGEWCHVNDDWRRVVSREWWLAESEAMCSMIGGTGEWCHVNDDWLRVMSHAWWLLATSCLFSRAHVKRAFSCDSARMKSASSSMIALLIDSWDVFREPRRIAVIGGEWYHLVCDWWRVMLCVRCGGKVMNISIVMTCCKQSDIYMRW